MKKFEKIRENCSYIIIYTGCFILSDGRLSRKSIISLKNFLNESCMAWKGDTWWTWSWV